MFCKTAFFEVKIWMSKLHAAMWFNLSTDPVASTINNVYIWAIMPLPSHLGKYHERKGNKLHSMQSIASFT